MMGEKIIPIKLLRVEKILKINVTDDLTYHIMLILFVECVLTEKQLKNQNYFDKKK